MARLVCWPFFSFTERRVRAFWRLLFQFMTMAIVLVVTFSLFLNVALNFDNMLSIAIVQGAITLLSVLAACMLFDRRRFSQLGFQIDRQWWFNVAAGFAIGFVAISIIFVIHLSAGWIQVVQSKDGLLRLLLNQAAWLAAMTMVGVSEETLSRGYMMKNIAEGLKPLGIAASNVLAILLSAIVFAIVHGGNEDVSVVALLSIFGAGIMLGIARITTGSLAAPIGMHVAWNYAQGGIYGFPVSGNKVGGSAVAIESTVDNVWTGGGFGPEAGLTGIIAVVVAILIFTFWPRSEAKSEAVAMVRYRRKTGAWLA